MRDGRWPGSGRGVARLIATLLAALMLAALVTVGGPAGTATAAEPAAGLRITLTKLSPAIVHPDSTIAFEGTVTNVSNRPLVRLQAMIWRSLTPITDRAGFEATNASPATEPEGERMYQQPPWYQDLYSPDQPNLAPGASRTFKLSASAADFLASSTPSSGLYLAGVQVRENGAATVGRARTYLPVVSDPQPGSGLQPDQTTIGTSTLVELATTPAMIKPGLFADDHLASEIAPGGRLDALLTAAEQSSASFAVDPDLIVELKSMTAKSGYQVFGADGKRRTGTGKADAAAWLSRFGALRGHHDGYQLLYGRPDLTSLVHAGRLDIVRAAQKTAGEVTETAGLPLMVLPADGAADRQTLAAARQLGARLVVLADTTVRNLGPVVSTPDSPTILSYDTETTAGGPGPDPRNTEVQLRQASLGDTYIDSISGRPAAGLGRLRLVTDAGQAGGETAALAAPWLRARPVGDLLSSTPEQLRGRLNYSAAERSRELSARQLDRLADFGRDLTTYRNALAEPAGVDELIARAMPRAASVAWRGQRSAMTGYLNDQLMLLSDEHGNPVSVRQLVDGTVVRVETNPQVTLTGASAPIPVTVVNTLNVALKLQLVAISPNRSRLSLDGIPASKLGQGTIAAGARLPDNVMAHADANGTLPIQLRLATPEGDPVGKPLSVRVNATRAGLVGWVIAIAAGVVLLGTVVLRIRQVARERSDADDEPTTTDDPAEAGETTGTVAAADPAATPTPVGAETTYERGGAQPPPAEQPVGSSEPAAGASAAGGSDDASRDGVPRG